MKIIRHKVPTPIKIVIAFASIIIVLALQVTIFQTGQYAVGFGISLIMFFSISIIYFNHKGYRIAWDENRIYMRPWGFWNILSKLPEWESMPYDEMASAWGTSAVNPAPGVTTAMPFQVLEIESKNNTQNRISLYGSGLNDEDLTHLLYHLYNVRPDILPDDLVRTLGS